jgi:hypothetical protein
VIYALISSLLGWVLIVSSDALYESSYVGSAVLFYSPGAVYAALVLLPFLPSLDGALKLRALALLICGALSYWASFTLSEYLDCASLHLESNYGLFSLVGITGVIGALIIEIGARMFIPLALRWRGWFMLFGAGFLGGHVFYTFLEH